MTWIDPVEMARRRAEREDAWLASRVPQGALAAPMVIRDSIGGIRGLQSMEDGQYYDSKRAMRRHYREAGVEEVGDDSSYTREAIRSRYAAHKQPKTQAEKDARRAKIIHDVQAGISRVNLTSRREHEIT